MAGQGSGGNVIAALCSFFIPGLGQLVQGRILGALFFFLSVSVCWYLAAFALLFFMALPALLFHLWAIINAARYRGF